MSTSPVDIQPTESSSAFTPAYLSLADARVLLIESGLYTDETFPSESSTLLLLEVLEAELDGWLGYRMAPTVYTEIIEGNVNGVGTTSEYPILEILKIEAVMPLSLPAAAMPWVGDVRSVYVGFPGGRQKITYRAGHEPIPARVKLAMRSLLLRAAEESGTSGDIGFLYQPTRDVTSLSLPGGASKSWKVGDTGKAADGQMQAITELDRLLAPLWRDRRMVTITSGV